MDRGSAPTAANNPDPEIEFKAFRERMNKTFKDYRIGRYAGGPKVSDVSVLRQRWPFRGYSTEVLAKVKSRARGNLKIRRGPVHLFPLRAAGKKHQRLDDAKALLNHQARRMWFAGLRYKRTLGAGGQGLAAVFQVKNGWGQTLDVVAKLILPNRNGQAGMDREQNVIDSLMRAPHILQRFDFEGFFCRRPSGYFGQPPKPPAPATTDPPIWPPPGGPDPPIDPHPDDMDPIRGSLEILVTECARFKDLNQMIGMAGWMYKTFPDRALWGIFRCLVKGIIALEFPPRHQRREGIHEFWGPPLPEVVPRLEGACASVIHFDLDPQNVLVFDFDSGEHQYMPTFKIGDLGLCVCFHDPTKFSNQELWSMRWRGKRGWLTPEQFSSDWERSVDPVAAAKTAADHVAGHYRGATMNMWQAAMIIWCCITLCHPEMPPVPECVHIQLPGVAGGPTKFLTYGAYILDPRFDHVDRDIRHTILWCLAHNPLDRPDLETLNRLVDERGGPQAAGPAGAGPDPSTTDSQLKEWFGKVLLEPRPKPLPTYHPYGPADQINPYLD